MLWALRVARLWTLPIGWIRIYRCTMRAHCEHFNASESSVYTVPLSPERISAALIVLRRWACNSVSSSKVGQRVSYFCQLSSVYSCWEAEISLTSPASSVSSASLPSLLSLPSLTSLVGVIMLTDNANTCTASVAAAAHHERGLSLQGRVSHCTGPRVDPTTCYVDPRG
jgi:hypothetical protein